MKDLPGLSLFGVFDHQPLPPNVIALEQKG
jgi:hypothetical protein